MEKRIFVAVLISIGFLWLWAAVAPKLFPDLMKKPVPEKAAVTSTTAPAPAAPPAAGEILEIRPDFGCLHRTGPPGTLSTPVALFKGEARGDGRRSRRRVTRCQIAAVPNASSSGRESRVS